MQKELNTLIVNLFAGPGAGKSTVAAGIFSQLKLKGINCELVQEFAKELVWQNRLEELNNQFFVSANQYHRLFMLNKKVRVIVTDAPILLGSLYTDSYFLKELLSRLHNSLMNINFFINRKKPYNPIGRLQTEQESKNLDDKILSLLTDEERSFITIDGDRDGINNAMYTIFNKL